MRVFSIISTLILTIAPARAETLESLVRVVYLAEVTSYCSLADSDVAKGFRRERDRIVAAADLGDAQVEEARALGWQLGYAEWQNRGLGGFRLWCRTEGAQAAAFFREIAARPE